MTDVGRKDPDGIEGQANPGSHTKPLRHQTDGARDLGQAGQADNGLWLRHPVGRDGEEGSRDDQMQYPRHQKGDGERDPDGRARSGEGGLGHDRP